MSDTPRTDAIWFQECKYAPGGVLAMRGLAQELEEELNQAKKPTKDMHETALSYAESSDSMHKKLDDLTERIMYSSNLSEVKDWAFEIREELYR